MIKISLNNIFFCSRFLMQSCFKNLLEIPSLCILRYLKKYKIINFNGIIRRIFQELTAIVQEKPYNYWNGERLLFNKEIFPDKLKDLGGKVLKATSFNLPPYTYKVQFSSKNLSKFYKIQFQNSDGSYGGWENNVMSSLAKNMNFKLDINPPPNGELWGENKNGIFTGIYDQRYVLSQDLKIQDQLDNYKKKKRTLVGLICLLFPTE